MPIDWGWPVDIGPHRRLYAYLQNWGRMAPCRRTAADTLPRCQTWQFGGTFPTRPVRRRKCPLGGKLQRLPCWCWETRDKHWAAVVLSNYFPTKLTFGQGLRGSCIAWFPREDCWPHSSRLSFECGSQPDRNRQWRTFHLTEQGCSCSWCLGGRWPVFPVTEQECQESIFRPSLQTKLTNLGSKDFRMQMKQAADGWDGQMKQLKVTERVSVQMVVQRAQRMVMSDQPKLSDWIARRHVRSDVAQNVLVTEQDRTVRQENISETESEWMEWRHTYKSPFHESRKLRPERRKFLRPHSHRAKDLSTLHHNGLYRYIHTK